MTNWHTANRRRARPARDPRRFYVWGGKITVAPPRGRWGTQNFAGFAAEMLQQFASSFGLTYEQMVPSYVRAEAEAIAESQLFWRAFYRHEAAVLARMRLAFQPFYDRIYQEVMFERNVLVLIGYDPQKLLPRPA